MFLMYIDVGTRALAAAQEVCREIMVELVSVVVNNHRGSGSTPGTTSTLYHVILTLHCLKISLYPGGGLTLNIQFLIVIHAVQQSLYIAFHIKCLSCYVTIYKIFPYQYNFIFSTSR